MVGYRACPMHLYTRCAGNALSRPECKPSRDREEAVTTLTGRHSPFQRRVGIRNGLFHFLRAPWGELMFRLKSAAEGKSRGPQFLPASLAY